MARDIQAGDHVWYELGHETNRSTGVRTMREVRARVERVINASFLVVRPYADSGRTREWWRSRRVAFWKVRAH